MLFLTVIHDINLNRTAQLQCPEIHLQLSLWFLIKLNISLRTDLLGGEKRVKMEGRGANRPKASDLAMAKVASVQRGSAEKGARTAFSPVQ